MKGDAVWAESTALLESANCFELGLPIPKIPYLDKLRSDVSERKPNGSAQQLPSTPMPQTHHNDATSSKPRRIRQDSFGNDPEADPWASPATQRPIAPSSVAHTTRPNGIPDHVTQSTAASLPQRTTSSFTTHGGSPPQSDNPRSGDAPSGGAGWSSYNGSSNEGFSEQQNLIGGGFGGDGGSQDAPGGADPRRSIGASAVIPHGSGEIITVAMLPEKEGMFLFQHRNYEVKSIRRSSSVVRRYSDFVWLLDCLLKRYPFRRLPLLPPKRVQGMYSQRYRVSSADRNGSKRYPPGS